MKRIVAILAPALLVWGCSRPAVEEVETKAAATVTTITLAPQTMEGIVAASGVVSAAPGADWTITAPEHGRIVDLPKAEGDRVKAGDLLVRFDIPSMQTDVATRRGELATAEARGLIERDPTTIRPTALGRRFLNDLQQLFLKS